MKKINSPSGKDVLLGGVVFSPSGKAVLFRKVPKNQSGYAAAGGAAARI